MSEGQTPATIDPATGSRSAATVRKALIAYIAVLWLLTSVALCVVAIEKFAFYQPYARNLVVCCRGYDFTDFTALSLRVAHFGEPGMLARTDIPGTTPYPYPVPTVYAYLFFVRLFPHPLVAYLVFAILTFCVATYCLSSRVKQLSPGYLPQIAVWSTLLLCYPLAFLLVRANIEAVIWVLVLLGSLSYVRNRMLPAALLWSAAGSMKIFPTVLFALFIARRKYGVFVFAIAATVIFTLAALAGIGPTIRQAVSDSTRGATFLAEAFILARGLPHYPQWDHSLFAAAKEAIHRYVTTFGGDEKGTIQRALRIYSITFPLAAGSLWWFRLRSMPLLNQYLAYLTMCILLPYVSYEYTLVYVCLIWGAFLLFLLQDVATAKVLVPAVAINIVLVSCACLLAPLGYLNRDSYPVMGGQIKAVCLLVLLTTLLRFPMPSSLFADLSPPANELESSA